MKTCPTCNAEFEPETGSHIYCTKACRQLGPLVLNMRATIDRHEHEIVNVLSLVQLQRKRIKDLNETVNSVRQLAVLNNLQGIKERLNVRD